MCLRSLIVTFTFSVSLTAFSQDSAVKALGAQYSYQSQDFFCGLHGLLQRNSLEHLVQFQVGVRTSFFQQRVFPQFCYQFSWYMLNRSNFRAGFSLRPVFSAIHSKKDSAHGFVFYEDLLPGLKFSFGKKNRFSLSGMYGPFLEQRYSGISYTYHSYLSWKFNAEISYSYVF